MEVPYLPYNVIGKRNHLASIKSVMSVTTVVNITIIIGRIVMQIIITLSVEWLL